VPCFTFPTGSCPTGDCVAVANECRSAVDKTACSIYVDQSDCETADNCKYHDDISLCWPADLMIPCDKYFDVETCPKDRCNAFEVFKGEYFCLPKDETPECGMYGSQDYCTTPCEWIDQISTCYDPEIGYDCNLWSNTGECPETECKAAGEMCLNKDQPVDCSAYWYADSLSCSADVGCMPDCTKQMCMPCPADGCPDVKPCASTIEPMTNCTQFLTPDECDNVSYCVWDDTIESCLNHGEHVPCDRFSTETDCEAQPNCNWEFSICIECTDCTPEVSTMPPDTGKDCATYDETQCPYPRCMWTFDEMGEGGGCHQATCDDLFEQETCSTNSSCAWEPSIERCYVKSDGYPCEDVFEEKACAAQKTCEWADYRCAGKDTGKNCNTYSMSSCPARCSVDWQSEKCINTPCSDYPDEDTCIAHKKDGCLFDQDTYSCYSDPDPSKACSTFKSYYTCPANRCFFTYDDECGTQAGSENGCCINIPCSNYYNEDTCKAAKCQYSNGLCYSDPDPSKDCKTFKSYSTCPGNRCEPIYDERGQFQCEAKVCSEYYDEGMCTGAKCQWDAYSYTCFNDTHLSCDKYEERTCPTNRCIFDYNNAICRTLQCADYISEEACKKSLKGCTFNEEYSVCYPESEKIPCSTFNYRKQDCPTDRCTYKEFGTVDVCYPINGSPPCGDFFDQSTCSLVKTCSWDAETFRCTIKP